MRRLAFLALLAFGLLALPATASAATCTVAVDTLDFGAVDSLFAAPVDTAARVHVSCDQVLAGTSQVTLCLHLGAGSGGADGGLRRLASGSQSLVFQLYQDGGRSIGWGGENARGAGAARRINAPVSGETASATVDLYGRVFGRQTSTAAGRYASSFGGADAFYSFAEGDLDCDAASGAGTGQTAFTIEATVADNCLVEATNIDFGQHGLIDHNIDAEATIDVTCTPSTGYSVTLGPGLGGGTDPEQRILRSGSHLARYGLYLDAARRQPWGSSIETQLPGTGTGARQTLPVYGRVPPQAVSPGLYSDTVAVTITYGSPPGV